MTIADVLANEEIRQHEFPVARQKVFLAHAGVCPLPRRVTEAIEAYSRVASTNDQEEAFAFARRVVVLEKSLAVGMGGIVSNNVHMTLHGSALPIYSVIAGLGGRPITRKSLHGLFQKAMADDLDQTEFLDLKSKVVERELEREQRLTRPGSIAENILRDLGVVDAAKTA